jgi:hypothetical protein
MKLKEIIKGIEDGTITILDKGHQCNPLLDILKSKYKHQSEQKKKYEKMIKNGETREDGSSYQGMVDIYDFDLNKTDFGQNIGSSEQYCFNCDSAMYIKLIDEKTIGYFPNMDYWKFAETKGEKYGYATKLEDLPICSASELTESQKLEATIEVPSGELIFQNYFDKEELYDGKEKYGKPSICSVLGRNKLMQELAEKNVGYGQMGNMSVTIYSNEKDEIIIGDNGDSYYDNVGYYENHPEKIDEEWLKSEKDYKEFEKYLEDGNFKEMGNISLSVWRWMCMDKQLLEEHGEKPKTDDIYQDSVNVNVQKGKYKIEHYYDFPENGDYIYSKLKLV